MKDLLSIGGAIAIAIGAAGTAHADNPRAATYLPDGNFQTNRGLIEFGAALDQATGGEIVFETFTGGVLLPARSLLSGIGDNVAQMGFHTTNYTPSDLPVIYALSGMGFVNPDPYVLGFAFTDWLMHEPEGLADYRRHGVIPVGGFSTAPYELICATDPIRSLDDIRGKKLRFPGGQAALLSDVLGFTTVSIPAPEMYQALQTGQIDCTAIYLTFLNVDMQLHEVADSITLMNLPPVFYDPLQLYNAEYWAGLTPEQRGIVFDLAADAMADVTLDFAAAVDEGIAFAEQQGIEVVRPDESLTGPISEWVTAGIGGMEAAATGAGVDDPAALFANFQTYLEKWDGLIGGMNDRRDRDELVALIRANIFDDLDTETYGLN